MSSSRFHLLCCRHAAFLALWLSGLTAAFAQDRPFSQFYSAPLVLNPALTGAFEGKFRVSAIYRDQWRRVTERPFTTSASSLDLRWPVRFSGSRYKDHGAIGVYFLNDRAGQLNFSTTQLTLSGAFHKALNLKGTQVLSLGFQAGVVQRNVNFGNITFEDQFNGVNAYDSPTAERLPENNYAFGDYSVGLHYVFSPAGSRFRLFTGAALHHITRPGVSFYQNADADTAYPDNRLDRRYTAHLGAQVPLSKGLTLLPRAVFDRQGAHMKLDAGTNVRISTSDYRSTALHIGGFARPVADASGDYRLDALVALVGFEINNVLIGCSYDLFLGPTTNFNRSSFELSVAYLGEYEDDLILCPKF